MLTIDPKIEKTSTVHKYILGAVAPRPIAFASTIDKEGNLNLSPFSLASTIISIEKFLKRERGKKNSPRTCDIDILDFKNKVFSFY